MLAKPIEIHPVQEHGSHTVLVVDDEPMVRMPISEYLRDCGYTVLEAANATEAMEVLDAHGPVNLVFSDVRMPGAVDGLGLAEWCRSHHPNMPVILTSGYTGAQRMPAMFSTTSRFVTKPYSQAQVGQRIAALLHS